MLLIKGRRPVVKTNVKVRGVNDLNTHIELWVNLSTTSVPQKNKTTVKYSNQQHASPVQDIFNIFKLCNNYIHLQVLPGLHCFASHTGHNQKYKFIKEENTGVKMKIPKNKTHTSSSLIRHGAWVSPIIRIFKKKYRANTFVREMVLNRTTDKFTTNYDSC